MRTQSLWQELRNAVYIAASVSQEGLHKYVMSMQWKSLSYNFHSQGFIWLGNKNNHDCYEELRAQMGAFLGEHFEVIIRF